MGSINLGFQDPAEDTGDAGFSNGPVDDSHWYSGIASAPVKGAWLGARALGNLVPDAVTDSVGELLDPDTKKKLFDDNIDALDRWAKNPYKEGFIGGLVKGAAKGITEFVPGMLIAGPLGGAAALGAAEGHDAYEEAVKQGVDQGTALAVGGVSGVINAATAALPFKLGSIAANLRLSAIGSDIAGNTTTSKFLSHLADVALPESTLRGAIQSGAATMGAYSGATYLNGEILRGNGYEEQAAQQDPFDLKMLAAQFVLGSAFHALGRMGDKPKPSELNTAIDTLREGHIKNSAPVIPVNGEQAAAAGDALNLAVEQMRRGDPVDVPVELSAKVLESDAVNLAHTEPARVLSNMSRPGKLVVKLKPKPDTVIAERPPVVAKVTEAADEFSAAKPLDDISEGNLRFLEDNAPDHVIDVDGVKMSMPDLRKHIESSMLAEKERVKIYDVAAACAMRNREVD